MFPNLLITIPQNEGSQIFLGKALGFQNVGLIFFFQIKTNKTEHSKLTNIDLQTRLGNRQRVPRFYDIYFSKYLKLYQLKKPANKSLIL